MTQDEKYEISVLAEDYESKRIIFQCRGMQNTQTDYEKRTRQAIDYHIAEAEMNEAFNRLQAAKHQPVGRS